MDNKDLAEHDTLHMLKGMLEYKQEEGLSVTAKEILQYIEKTLQKEEANLNERFPNKAR